MDFKDRTIELYAILTNEVVEILNQNGCYYVELKWIAHKYGEVKEVFLHAYKWYVSRASELVSKPVKAESAVWTFLNPKYIEKHSGNTIVKLCVPMEEAVFFRMLDWNKILNLRYVGKNAEEEAEFHSGLEKSGIQYEGDVYNSPYYPHLKRQLVESWNNLFRYDFVVKQRGIVEFEDMQAGLWCVKKEWVVLQ